MFFVTLNFSTNKAQAGDHKEDHKVWLQKGFKDGVFLLAGRLKPEGGGGILAHNTDRQTLDLRIADDPFVKHAVVTAEVVEIDPAFTDERLAFLKDGTD